MMEALRSALPPAGHPISLFDVACRQRDRDLRTSTETRLGEVLGARHVYLCRSGREALSRIFALLARRSGRAEVIMPGYTCYSIPAAAVAAGLRVRLVDVDASGRIDPQALSLLPLERAAALVVCNLFGVPEPIAPVAAMCEQAGVAIIDDAAQSIGGRADDGAVGTRGDFGVLSFGRGKPLSALGGGALVSPSELTDVPEMADLVRPHAGQRHAERRLGALARALAYDAALLAPVFGILRSIPALGIGLTTYEPNFARGEIDPVALPLLSLSLDQMERQRISRVEVACELAHEVASSSDFRPLLADTPEAGVYPRLTLVAPSAVAQQRAIAALHSLGAGTSPLYPQALSLLEPLAPALAGPPACPNAIDLAARIITLPTHGRLRGRRRQALLRCLGAIT